MTGEAFAMRIRLARLAARHGVAAQPVSIPLAPPSDRPVIVEGVAASATTVDLSRMLFREFAFPLPVFSWEKRPPLLYRHGEPAGEIEALEYDRDGSLRVRARVDHVEARRCNAFSVCATVHDYELRNEDSADYYALIKQAEIVEISLTDQPACPAALVDFRSSVPPHREFYRNAQRGIEIIQRIVTVIGCEIDRVVAVDREAREARPQSKPARALVARPTPRIEAHRATEFGKLVTAMERAHAS